MNKLLEQHPDLKDIINELKVYKIITEDNRIVEYWEKNENGEWIDYTEREKLKEEIMLAQNELEKIKENENGKS